LDTNFWLATHVTCVTLGYTATFVAGFFGILFVVLGVFTNRLNRERFKSLSQIIYGVVCFATLLSFTGTVLGGIWADQSWARFWPVGGAAGRAGDRRAARSARAAGPGRRA